MEYFVEAFTTMAEHQSTYMRTRTGQRFITADMITHSKQH